MSLLELSRTNPNSFENYLAKQIVAFAGDGNLRDGSECSLQLRAYLTTTSSTKLEKYAQECLEQPFPDSGLVLQDVVNELGRRLEFEVEHGRYRGVPNKVGFDGVWRVPGGPTIVVEVKSTDTYNVSLETVAEYRAKLIASGELKDGASFLFVVGRKDTGALEAQIRGSRYAWDMRVVGVESLLKLVRVKEKSSEDQTIAQIRELLRPFEYTRVDRILDVVFSAATDAVNETEAEGDDDLSEEKDGWQQERTPQTTLDDVRLRAVASTNTKFGLNLVRKRQALFEDATINARACVTVSKRYDEKLQPYWYAYHPKWDDFLADTQTGLMIFACVDRDQAFAVPVEEMRRFIPSLNQTIRPDGSNYWHVKLVESGDSLAMLAPKTGKRFELHQFQLAI